MCKIPSIFAIITYALPTNGMDAEEINKLNNEQNLIPEIILHEEPEAEIDVVSICPHEEKIQKEIKTVRSQPFSKATRRLMFHPKQEENYIAPSMLLKQFKGKFIEEKKLPIKKRRLSAFRALKTRRITTK